MRIFVDAHAFDNGNSEGVTTYIRGLYGAMTAMAPEDEFFFAARDVDNLRGVFGTAPNIRYLALGDGGRFRRLAADIPRLIARNGIDFAHFQYTLPAVKRCREIVTVHDILFRDFPQYFPRSYRAVNGALFGRSVRRADIVLTVSEYSRGRLEHYYGPRRPIAVTPNAVPEEFAAIGRRRAAGMPACEKTATGGPYILYVSRVEPRKNHVMLVRAFDELGLWRRGYRLVCIGRKALPVPRLEEYLAGMEPRARESVLFLHDVGREELAGWYAGASLFVYPSLAEGFGIPPLEAAAACVPCLSSRATAMGDFDFFGDRLFDPDDLPGLERLMERVLADPDPERTAMTARRVAERYDWRGSAAVLYDKMKTMMR